MIFFVIHQQLIKIEYRAASSRQMLSSPARVRNFSTATNVMVVCNSMKKREICHAHVSEGLQGIRLIVFSAIILY